MSHKGRKIPVTDVGASKPADDEERLAEPATGDGSNAGGPGGPTSRTTASEPGQAASQGGTSGGENESVHGGNGRAGRNDGAGNEKGAPRGVGGEAPPGGGPVQSAEGDSDATGPTAGQSEETARAAQARISELEAEIARLQNLLDAEQRRLQDVLLAYRRQKDELTRHRERLEEDLRRRFEEDRAKMLAELLDVADNLDRSIHATRQSGSIDALLDGLLGVHHQFMRVLEKIGVEQVDPLGRPFDPHAHEAIAVVPVDDPTMHQHVVEVLRPGYRVGGRLLRPALVKVGQRGAT